MELALYIAALALSTVTVSTAEETLFVREGGSVRLDVLGYEKLQFSVLSWHFNITKIMHMYVNDKLITYGAYKTTTEFDKGNYSLLLKNVQQKDSGIYTANTPDEDTGNAKYVATYIIKVQEALPKPQMRVTLISSAGGFCNVSVNCSSKDTKASYTCDHNYCTQVANITSPTGVNITVMATNGTLHCRTSNKVDTKSKSESTRSICQPKENPVGHNSWVIIVIFFSIILILIILIFFLYICVKIKRNSGGSEIKEQVNTEYASVQGAGVHYKSPGVRMYDTVTSEKPERRLEVTTVYDTLGSAGDTSVKPESVYSTVNKNAS